MVLSVFVGRFFALRGEKTTYKEEKCVVSSRPKSGSPIPGRRANS